MLRSGRVVLFDFDGVLTTQASLRTMQTCVVCFCLFVSLYFLFKGLGVMVLVSLSSLLAKLYVPEKHQSYK